MTGDTIRDVGQNVSRTPPSDRNGGSIGVGMLCAKAARNGDHSIGEYVRGDVHTNTMEGFYSIFKRGMKGIYQHCSERHLHRYVAEFDFRYNNRSALGIEDAARATKALQGVVGKRLTYR